MRYTKENIENLILNNKDLFYEFISKPRLWLYYKKSPIHSFYLLYYNNKIYDYNIENCLNDDFNKPIFENLAPVDLNGLIGDAHIFARDKNLKKFEAFNFLSNFKKYIILKKLSQ